MSSIQVSCQLCYQPFGSLNDDRAPYALSCSHVCCVSCLGGCQSSCPLCYMAFDEAACRRMLRLSSGTTKINSPEREDADRARQLQDAISRVDEQTSLYRLRHLHEMANSFLETQPRNRCKELESSLKLLRALLWAKEALVAQSNVVDNLTSRLEKLGEENHRLRCRAGEEEQSLNREKVNVWRHLRGNPEFRLLQDELVQCRAEMNDLHSVMQALKDPPPPPSLPLSNQSIPPPILTPTPAYQEATATANHVKFQLPRYDESPAAPEVANDREGMLFLPAFPDEPALDDSFASPPPALPLYSSVLPDIGTWSREKEKDDSKWFASGVDVDPSLLWLIDARAHTGYVPLSSQTDASFWPYVTAEDTGSDGSSEAGPFLTGPIPIEESPEIRDGGGVPVHVTASATAHQVAELSPLGLSLVSSPEVRPRPPDDDELSDTGTSSDDDDESDENRLTRASRQKSLSSSLTLLKTPKHHPRLDANYLQSRLHELLEDNLALNLGRQTSNLGFGLARAQTSLRIADLDLPQGSSRTIGQSTQGQTGGGGSGTNPHPRLAGWSDDIELDLSLTPRGGLSKKKSRASLKGKSNPRQLKSSKATPIAQLEEVPVTSTSTSTSTSLSIARPQSNLARPRSSSENFRSRIPRFAIPKFRQDSDGYSDSDGDASDTLTEANRVGMGLTLDPNALAERFMEELQGCLVEIIARVFVQLLAELRLGASVSVAHGRKGRGRNASALLGGEMRIEGEGMQVDDASQVGDDLLSGGEDYGDEGLTDDDASQFGGFVGSEVSFGGGESVEVPS